MNNKINANYIDGLTSTQGELWFYEDGFEFKISSVNKKMMTGKILYKDVVYVGLENTFGIVPNAIAIVLNDKKKLIFAVVNRRKVQKFFESKINA